MAGATKCQTQLLEHVICTKDFLREARTNDLIYEPGGRPQYDRCRGTRDNYAMCMHKPADRVEGQTKVIAPGTFAEVQAKPMDFCGTTPQGGTSPARWESFGNVGKLKGKKSTDTGYNVDGSIKSEPPPCESVLTQHGQCVANALKIAVAKGDSKGYLVTDDKCDVTRGAFGRCLVHHREVAEGRRTHDAMRDHDPHVRISRRGSGIFAINPNTTSIGLS